MTSISDRATVDEIIAANGSDGITHIIEYRNQFDGRTTWKLCKGERHYEYEMVAGAFIEPLLIWRRKQIGLGDF
jgi:hypothetical protein